MRTTLRKFVFQGVYEMAALVEECIDNPDSIMELDWEDPELLQGLTRPTKVSLLHRYIYSMIAVEMSHAYRKNADLYDSEAIAEVEGLLDAYEITFVPYAQFVPRPEREPSTREDDPFYQWFLAQRDSFHSLWEKITEEVFHLLFGNRAFLLKFNRAIAHWLADYAVPQKCLSPHGRITRYPPAAWIRRAIFYRDQGRCVLCHCDLSGLLSTDYVDHFDHMVPLANWGTNDPCNLQLLCGDCNMRKAAGNPVTGSRYCPWWAE